MESLQVPELGTRPAQLLPAPRPWLLSQREEAAGWRAALSSFFFFFPPSSLRPHPEGKKFTRAAIRRRLSGGHVISLWFYYLKSVWCPGWGIFQGV